MRGPVLSVTTVQFDLKLINSRIGKYGIPSSTRDDFHLRRTAYNEAMVSLVKSLQGPQDIELELEVKLYHNGLFGGSSKAFLFIYVSQYEY
jgi:fibulin 1/2